MLGTSYRCLTLIPERLSSSSELFTTGRKNFSNRASTLVIFRPTTMPFDEIYVLENKSSRRDLASKFYINIYNCVVRTYTSPPNRDYLWYFARAQCFSMRFMRPKNKHILLALTSDFANYTIVCGQELPIFVKTLQDKMWTWDVSSVCRQGSEWEGRIFSLVEPLLSQITLPRNT